MDTDMQQRITVEQLMAETTEEQREALRKWWSPKHGDFYWWQNPNRRGDTDYRRCQRLFVDEDNRLVINSSAKAIPLLSIGQCTDILDEWGDLTIERYRVNGKRCWNISLSNCFARDVEGGIFPELIDGLWELVKQVLTPPKQT